MYGLLDIFAFLKVKILLEIENINEIERLN